MADERAVIVGLLCGMDWDREVDADGRASRTVRPKIALVGAEAGEMDRNVMVLTGYPVVVTIRRATAEEAALLPIDPKGRPRFSEDGAAV